MNAILLILLLPSIAFLIIRTIILKERPANLFFKRLFLSIYLLTILIYIATLIFENYNIYIKGYRSTSLLFLTMSLTGIIYWFIDREKISSIFRGLLFVFTLIIIAMASILAFEIIGDYKNQLIYNDSTFRLEETGRSLMNPCGLPTLFVKNNLYEEEFQLSGQNYCVVKSDIIKVEIEFISKTKVSVIYFFTNNVWKDTPNPLHAVYVMQ